MRNFTEPPARNLLRKPLVLGVPLPGLLALALTVLSLSVLLGTSRLGGLISGGTGAIGYACLRLFARFAKNGWEESLIFPLERLAKITEPDGKLTVSTWECEVSSPDTLEQSDLIRLKNAWLDRIKDLREDERVTLLCEVTQSGATLREVTTHGRFSLKGDLDLPSLTSNIIPVDAHLYSLHQLPVGTDPLWLFAFLSKLKTDYRVLIGIRGVNPLEIKRRIEHSRRSNAREDRALADIDSEVTFEEASQVLQGISRGAESVVEISMVVVSSEALSLDPTHFCEEKNPVLAALSVLGIRKRFHRSHWVRAETASDLIPNILDPKEDGRPILTTLRGNPLYFSPQDSRLEALHWLVVGASGSGKSFFTGLVLRRMVRDGAAMSVLFVDHNRSFRRMVLSQGGQYLEPAQLETVEREFPPILKSLDQPGTMMGIELSDLDHDDKKAAAFGVLSQVEAFLRARDTVHPVYLVLDECWNFMRDQPVLVQRAFREFRKLNGAAIAITQSLSDFLTDVSGQSIFQNAPIRILLRQGEDLGRYQGVLGLNPVELAKTRYLQQRKGVFSECLIKTPFLSRIGRLYPTEEEHALLRTDNIRSEMIEEARLERARLKSCEKRVEAKWCEAALQSS